MPRLALVALALFAQVSAAESDWPALRTQVMELGALVDAPRQYPVEGMAPDGTMRPLYFEALPWKGKPTRVFAWLGIPEHKGGRLPGVVLVHGGGGTAFKEWVKKWNDAGFAAISIAVEGQTDTRIPEPKREENRFWERHAWGGPARQAIYGDSEQPLADQWMYHAVADTILAHSLLRSLPEVDPARIGVVGISWGGVITSTVIGIDSRFAFAVPTYGCGHLADAQNQYGRALGRNSLYREVWDPVQRLARAKLPVLWLSWPGDQHFPLDCQAASYRAAPGPRMVSLRPGMQHGHPPGWNPPDSYAFAQSVVRDGRPWLRQTEVSIDAGVRVTFESAKPVDRAVLVWTSDKGFTGKRVWNEAPARLEHHGDRVVVKAELPQGVTAWFINVQSGALIGSSDYQECAARD